VEHGKFTVFASGFSFAAGKVDRSNRTWRKITSWPNDMVEEHAGATVGVDGSASFVNFFSRPRTNRLGH
jgi:hypothetical protein